MTRKLARAMAGVLLAIAAIAGCTSPAAPHPKPPRPKPPRPSAIRDRSRPNFVFVLTDDLSWNLVSHMPHVLALEQAGTTMSRYYVVDSLCCPSRSAIFTGEYPHDDGSSPTPATTAGTAVRAGRDQPPPKHTNGLNCSAAVASASASAGLIPAASRRW